MAAMRRYVITVLALLSASALGLLGFGYHFHALTTPASLARLQARDGEDVVLPADLRYNAAFKIARVEEVQPDVLCISSSRAGTLRDWMFKPYRFYNASFTAWTTAQLLDVFEHLTRKVRPRVVIVALDYFLFTDSWDDGYKTQRAMIYQPSRYVSFKLTHLLHALPAPVAFQEDRRQDGFRRDGSYLYPPSFIEMARSKLQTAQHMLEAAPGAPQMSERQMAPIVQLASLAKQRGIKLIAVQLPYVRGAVDYLDTNEAYRPYSGVWRDFESEQTAGWLRSLGIVFFDLAHSPIADDPMNFIDAYHPSEQGMVKLLKQLLNEKEFQDQLPDLNATG